eukprot:TRINITY_DN62499_c0_g1_i1.p2 TRINITY_DN62499_c0_g1~~TRINITY_DN62499_c0_g1_i1.p2  ORF type:complete len:115 (-),score=19.45 TRINITY_DN62499_c0_g1_i1:18-362(-)
MWVIYMEACNAGSMFRGLLPPSLPVYVTTAANSKESSWASYCPSVRQYPIPSEFNICLGDLYSVSWLENSEVQNLSEESLEAQYKVVRDRTSQGFTYLRGSHVMQYENRQNDNK